MGRQRVAWAVAAAAVLIAVAVANRHLTGVAVVGVGLLLNLVAIVLNNGLPVRQSALERYDAEIQRAISAVAVWQADCNGYYRSPSGRVVTQWPHTMSEYQRRTEAPQLDSYEATQVAAQG